MSPDYSKSSVYVIRNHINDFVYVGSTTQSLAKRWGHHKSVWKAGKYQFNIYKAFTELGINNFYIELYEEINCENRQQLEKREGEVIRSFKKAVYNMKMIFVEELTSEQWYEKFPSTRISMKHPGIDKRILIIDKNDIEKMNNTGIDYTKPTFNSRPIW